MVAWSEQRNFLKISQGQGVTLRSFCFSFILTRTCSAFGNSATAPSYLNISLRQFMDSIFKANYYDTGQRFNVPRNSKKKY